MRRIITYSTLGDNMKEVFSSAETWGDLMPDLTRASIRFDGMKVMTNPGQVTLESLQAELPEGEFQLFIMPQKVKSGHGDSHLIDEEDGIDWTEIDWTDETINPEDYVFATRKDLAMARAKKAFCYLEKAIEFLAGAQDVTNGPATSKPTSSNDPFINSLREEAEKLQKSLNVFY